METNITSEKKKVNTSKIVIIILAIVISFGGSFLIIKIRNSQVEIEKLVSKNQQITWQLQKTNAELIQVKYEFEKFQQENISYFDQLKKWWSNDDDNKEVEKLQNSYTDRIKKWWSKS